MEKISEVLDFVKHVVSEHETFWALQLPKMRNLNSIYKTEFYTTHRNMHNSAMIEVETADAYAFVESLIGSLFLRSPSIEVAEDPLAQNQQPKLVRELVNRFLKRKLKPLQDASKLAIIFPNSFLKLAPCKTTDILEMVDIRAVQPWDVIVDLEADMWERQRYCAHIYYMNIKEAEERFGTRNFTGVGKVDYFDKYSTSMPTVKPILESMSYVQIVEFYNLVRDKLYFYSPQYKKGEEFISSEDIPIRDFDGRPLPAIVPLYYTSMPDRPLQGYSALSRIYDQLVEKNLLRTRMANAVRKDARQYLYNRERVDETTLTGLALGQDGVLIPVDGDLSNVVVPITAPSVSVNHDRYAAEIESDLTKGTIMAPFSRGEATQATATEVNLLQAYASSEIGKFARERDVCLESLANLYIRLLSTVIGDEDVVIPIKVENQVKLLRVEDLEGKYTYQAVDQASSPISESIKQQQLSSLSGLLVSLGASPQKVLEEVVRIYRLPQHLAEPVQQQTQQPQPGQAAGGLTEKQIELLLGENLNKGE